MTKNKITPIGAKVKKTLRQKGMKQVELAGELGISVQYLYMMLRGSRPIEKYLAMITEICGIDMETDNADSKESEIEMEKFLMIITPKPLDGYPLTTFGEMVKEALQAKGMKQVELAKELGCSKQYLHIILHGRRAGWKYISKIIQICEIEIPDAQDTEKGGDYMEEKPDGKGSSDFEKEQDVDL